VGVLLGVPVGVDRGAAAGDLGVSSTCSALRLFYELLGAGVCAVARSLGAGLAGGGRAVAAVDFAALELN
jgi:hypothetical protein